MNRPSRGSDHAPQGHAGGASVADSLLGDAHAVCATLHSRSDERAYGKRLYDERTYLDITEWVSNAATVTINNLSADRSGPVRLPSDTP